jgi:TonB family protein
MILKRLLVAVLLFLGVASSVLSQTDDSAARPKFVKFKTDPPGGIIIAEGVTHQTSDSAHLWTKVDLSTGTHKVVVKGQAKRFTFDLVLEAPLGTYVTVNLDDEQVWSLREKGYRSKLLAATVEPDSSTTYKERKKPKADSTAVVAAKDPKDTAANKPIGTHVEAEVEDSAQITVKIEPKMKDLSKLRDMSGPAVIKALVNEKGGVVEARIDRSSGSKEFDRAALDAGRKYKFKPATRGGKPVATWVTFPVDYTPPTDTGARKP